LFKEPCPFGGEVQRPEEYPTLSRSEITVLKLGDKPSAAKCLANDGLGRTVLGVSSREEMLSIFSQRRAVFLEQGDGEDAAWAIFCMGCYYIHLRKT
jgi:hypothetical protein